MVRAFRANAFYPDVETCGTSVQGFDHPKEHGVQRGWRVCSRTCGASQLWQTREAAVGMSWTGQSAGLRVQTRVCASAHAYNDPSIAEKQRVDTTRDG